MSRPKFIQVTNMNAGMDGVATIVKVVSRADADKEGKAEVVVGDTTGVITLRAEAKELEACVPGSCIRIQNAKVKMHRTGNSGFMRLAVGKWGKVAEATEDEAAQVKGEANLENDRSAVEHE